MAARAQQCHEATSDQLRWGPGLTPAANSTAGTAWAPGGRRRPTGSPGAEETPLEGGLRCSNFPTRKSVKFYADTKSNLE
jgi:hypothetical protein